MKTKKDEPQLSRWWRTPSAKAAMRKADKQKKDRLQKLRKSHTKKAETKNQNIKMPNWKTHRFTIKGITPLIVRRIKLPPYWGTGIIGPYKAPDGHIRCSMCNCSFEPPRTKPKTTKEGKTQNGYRKTKNKHQV